MIKIFYNSNFKFYLTINEFYSLMAVVEFIIVKLNIVMEGGLKS